MGLLLTAQLMLNTLPEVKGIASNLTSRFFAPIHAHQKTATRYCYEVPVGKEHRSIRCGRLMSVITAALCFQFVPQVTHKASPEVKRQLLSGVIMPVELVHLQLMFQVIPHRHLVLCGVTADIFHRQCAMILTSLTWRAGRPMMAWGSAGGQAVWGLQTAVAPMRLWMHA